MSHYCTRYCAEHGDYDADIDGDQECEKCVAEGKTERQVMQRRIDELERRLSAIDSAEMPRYPRDWNSYMNTSRHADWIEQYVEKLRNFAQAPSARADEMARDTERLNFVIAKQAFISTTYTDTNQKAYQLMIQDEDENFITISGENKFFSTTRTAIDAAIAAWKGEA